MTLIFKWTRRKWRLGKSKSNCRVWVRAVGAWSDAEQKEAASWSAVYPPSESVLRETTRLCAPCLPLSIVPLLRLPFLPSWWSALHRLDWLQCYSRTHSGSAFPWSQRELVTILSIPSVVFTIIQYVSFENFHIYPFLWVICTQRLDLWQGLNRNSTWYKITFMYSF